MIRRNQGLPINTDTMEKSQKWDSKRSGGSHPERRSKEQAQHQTRRNSSHKGAKTNTAAGDRTISLDDLRNEQMVTAPKGRNQKATSQPERQDMIVE